MSSSGFTTDSQSVNSFLKDYLLAVAAYREIRQQIDRIFDEKRRKNGIEADQSVAVDSLKVWQATLPQDLIAEEVERREFMDSFTQMKPLRVGEVVRVPCFTPHALQHGVRSVEFQTPVYERKILSFAQKVLTQEHWDTEEALERIDVEVASWPNKHPQIRDELGLMVERIVDFDDFKVQRARLAPAAEFTLSSDLGYALVMALQGSPKIGEIEINPEECCLLPASADAMKVCNHTDKNILLLIAYQSILIK